MDRARRESGVLIPLKTAFAFAQCVYDAQRIVLACHDQLVKQILLVHRTITRSMLLDLIALCGKYSVVVDSSELSDISKRVAFVCDHTSMLPYRRRYLICGQTQFVFEASMSCENTNNKKHIFTFEQFAGYNIHVPTAKQDFIDELTASIHHSLHS